MSVLHDMMSGMVLTGHGGPERLEWRDDLPVPRPGPTDVVIRVTASAVNNTDINTRVGWYSKSDDAGASWSGEGISFPLIQGIDACGRIAAVGEDVDPARLGERVLVEPCLRRHDGVDLDTPAFLGSQSGVHGGFAEYLRVDTAHAHAVESPLSDTDLATFPCSWSTALNMLTRAGVREGEHLLVTGASGGVGSAAVSLATALGAKVTAVTSKSEAVRATGAAATLARGDDPRKAGPFDAVVDLVGGPGFGALLEALRPGGRLSVSGAVAGPVVETDLRTLYLNDLSLFGCTALGEGVFARLVALIESGRIRPLVDAVFAVSEMRAAQEAFAGARGIGKIALRHRTADEAA